MLLKSLLATIFLGSALVSVLLATPPHCKMVDRDGKTFQICTREDANCESLAEEQAKEPSKAWNGCTLPVTVIKSYLSVANVGTSWVNHVVIVPSFRDSEKMDIAISVEQPDHSYRIFQKKDVQIIIEDDDIPRATADFWSIAEPIGVPTVKATEKGGNKEASHSFK